VVGGSCPDGKQEEELRSFQSISMSSEKKFKLTVEKVPVKESSSLFLAVFLFPPNFVTATFLGMKTVKSETAVLQVIRESKSLSRKERKQTRSTHSTKDKVHKQRRKTFPA